MTCPKRLYTFTATSEVKLLQNIIITSLAYYQLNIYYSALATKIRIRNAIATSNAKQKTNETLFQEIIGTNTAPEHKQFHRTLYEKRNKFI